MMNRRRVQRRGVAVAIDTTTRTEVQHYKNYIGGEWVDAGVG